MRRIGRIGFERFVSFGRKRRIIIVPLVDKVVNYIMEFIDYHSKDMSADLAAEKGRFLNFEGSVYDGKNYLYDKYRGKSSGMISDEDWMVLDKKIQES